jgi:transposase
MTNLFIVSLKKSKPMENLKTYYGIDVSLLTLQITHQTNEIWKDEVISNTVIDIDNWLSGLSLSESHFTFEYSGTYSNHLAYGLSLVGANFSIITAKQSKGFRDTLKQTSKTDKQDARCLALYGKQIQPVLTILPDEKLSQKRQQYKHLAVLKHDRQAFSNRLHALSFDSKADKFVLASTHEITTFLEQQIQIIEQQIFTIDDNEAERIMKLMMSVSGIGEQSAKAVLIATNGFEGFDNSKQVSKFLGVCSSDKQSGTSIKGAGSIPKSGVEYVRTTLYMAALSAKKYNLVCKDLYTRLRAKGKAHKVAMIAVVHKLVTQLFAVVNNNTIFNNNYIQTK